MRFLTRRALVRCSCETAIGELQHAIERGGPLRLKAPVRLPAVGADIELRHATEVFIERDGSSLDGRSVLVRWRPERAHGFPRFAGTLVVNPDTCSTCWLRLDGTYEEPYPTLRLVEPGERAVGYRIALATAALLLQKIARSTELFCAVGAEANG